MVIQYNTDQLMPHPGMCWLIQILKNRPASRFESRVYLTIYLSTVSLIRPLISGPSKQPLPLSLIPLSPSLPSLMIKTLSAEDLAYHVEIPGSRVGPDDGPWPRPYRILAETELTRELELTAKPLTFPLCSRYSAHGVNFQPCHLYSTQDRYTVKQLNVHGRVWTFTGVFDGTCPLPPNRSAQLTPLSLLKGHLGDLTVEHTAYHLPIIVKELLSRSPPERLQDPAEVSRILSESTTSFDRAIAGDILKIFPGGIEALQNMSQSTVQAIINRNADPQLLKNARLCMYGTTALVALVDPDHQNLWVANVGDCQAGWCPIMPHFGIRLHVPSVFVSQNGPLRWKSELLTSNHNCDNDTEASRVITEHPGEPECILDRRVLGALAPTRCNFTFCHIPTCTLISV